MADEDIQPTDEPTDEQPADAADASADASVSDEPEASSSDTDLAAMAAAAIAAATGADESDQTSPFTPEELEDVGITGVGGAEKLDLLDDVNLHVRVELGRTSMLVEDVLRLDEGSVVELEKLAGDPVDVFVNGRLVARGEVLVLNENFCIRVSEVLIPSAKDARGDAA